MKSPLSKRKITRREALAATALVGAVSLIPYPLRWAVAEELSSSTAGYIKKITGGKKVIEGRINLRAPVLAEDGSVVPITFEVYSPMTESDYVKSATVFVDNNPFPDLLTVNFTPSSGSAFLSARIRMAKSSPVRVFATMSDGSVYTAKKNVKVTIGGC